MESLLWTGDAIKIIHNIEPRLASWEKHIHPAQIRLQSYLDQLVAAIMPLPPQPQPLFLHLDIDVGFPERLVRHYDLENYLTSLFGRRWLDPSRFVLVSARKQVGEGSRLVVGVAQPQTPALQGWEHFTCLAGSGTQTKQLTLHRNVDPGIGQNVAVGMWWRAAISKVEQ